MKIISCNHRYLGQILEIFNDAILHTTALYDYKPRSLETVKGWIDQKIEQGHRITGIIDDSDILLAFGSYGSFRAWPAYKYTVEHSLYVHKDHRGKGLGKAILEEIIRDVERNDYHNMIAGIDSTNLASIQLHKKFGFEYCGRVRHAGYKFSRWLDLEFYQLLLPGPAHPADGQ